MIFSRAFVSNKHATKRNCSILTDGFIRQNMPITTHGIPLVLINIIFTYFYQSFYQKVFYYSPKMFSKPRIFFNNQIKIQLKSKLDNGLIIFNCVDSILLQNNLTDNNMIEIIINLRSILQTKLQKVKHLQLGILYFDRGIRYQRCLSTPPKPFKPYKLLSYDTLKPNWHRNIFQEFDLSTKYIVYYKNKSNKICNNFQTEKTEIDSQLQTTDVIGLRFFKLVHKRVGMTFFGPNGNEKGNCFDQRSFQLLKLRENSPMFIFLNYKGIDTIINTWFMQQHQSKLIYDLRNNYNKRRKLCLD